VILVDTSIWIDYFRDSDDHLRDRLQANNVCTHPMVLGELACGQFNARREIFSLLDALPSAVVATDTEARAFIEQRALMGRGIGFIDVHLLAATALTGDTRLWTRDKRLHRLAEEAQVAYR
jgi:predicted nucleic acid-binding protein